MSISSQAGLASIRRTNRPTWTDQTITIRLNATAYELRLSDDGRWYVIHAQPDWANVQALVGQGFEPGRNPWEWTSGYASRIQQELNKVVNRD